jgi:peptidoglycan/LPS O-acetylase OafA/YrhL
LKNLVNLAHSPIQKMQRVKVEFFRTKNVKKQIPVKYFNNLDGLRFLAAFAVIFGHIQHVIHQYQGYYPYVPYANKLASFGVDFFFVLSGFLISYLLMQEIEKTGTINIRHFYYRRFLRIFPLYFLVGLLGIITGDFWVKYFDYLSLNDAQYMGYVYNQADLFKNLFFLCTFSINFQTLLGLHNPVSSLSVGHFWSLGIEEQYYLIWAPTLFFFRRYVGAVIVAFLCVGFYFSYLPESDFKGYFMFQYNFTVTRFWYFGLGAAFAWWIQHFSITMLLDRVIIFFHKMKLPPSVFRAILSPKSLIFMVYGIQLCCLIPALYYLFGAFYVHFNEFIVNALVALLIIAVAVADYSILSVLSLENRVFKYLGKISYGIYIFHIFSIYFTYKLLKDIGIVEKSTLFYTLYPIVATLISIGLAALSYEFFEKRFLALKHKFEPRINEFDKLDESKLAKSINF